MRVAHTRGGNGVTREPSGARAAAKVLFASLCLGLASLASSARSAKQPVLGPYGSQWEATAPADQARFMLRTARSRAEAAEREAQFTAPSGTFYDIKENVRAMAEASRQAAKRLAAQMLAGNVAEREPGVGDTATPDSSHKRSAALCDGFRVALDLHDGGVPAMLDDEELAGIGIPVDSLDLPGVAGGVDSSGAPEPGHACIIPTAVCGEGRDASVRFDWGLQRQRFNSVSCDPSPELVGHAFLPVNRLVPADDQWAGLARVGEDGQHCGARPDERAPMADDWAPGSWRAFEAKQQPKYADKAALDAVLAQVKSLPPLVCSEEVDDVRRQLAEVAEGKRFLLQGGDCAERFADCNSSLIENKLRILLQMSLVLTWGARMPTLRIGRMAGQYSKPRSADMETVEGVGLVPSFRGENVNGFDATDRAPDPQRLLAGYFHSAATLNYVRSLLDSGFSDLHRARSWELGFVKDPAQKAKYEAMTAEILSALDFMRTVGGSSLDGAEAVRRASIFSSHEGLHLDFEQALTRSADSAASIWDRAAGVAGAPAPAPEDSEPSTAAAAASSPPAATSPASRTSSPGAADAAAAAAGEPSSSSRRWYNLGAHFLWIGDRTRALDGAHIEYFRGIANPIGVKVGPSMKRAELVPLIRMLWPSPEEQPGKIVLITRLGAGRVRELLPPFIRAVQAARLPVVWTCDPMHGNTRKSSVTGLKTRDFADVVSELRDTFEVHRELGSRLGGVHFELTGEDVTECTGGPSRVAEEDLPLRYMTHCDPRLNYAQSMELAFLIASYLRSTAAGTEGAATYAWKTSSLDPDEEGEAEADA